MNARRFAPWLLLAATACGGTLPKGVDHFVVGRTTVRVDSALDYVGALWRVTDTASVPPRGPMRQWLDALRPYLGDSTFDRSRAIGLAPISLILNVWQAPNLPDTACGLLAPGERRCFTGDGPMREKVRAFFAAVHPFPPALDEVTADARHRDLEDVYVALTAGKSLDSAVIAYTGYRDLTFDVTLARTLPTGLTTPSLDPSTPRAPDWRIFLSPDDAYPTRSYRSPNYIWLALGHQMAHTAIRRLLADHPELVDRSIRLRPAIEGEMVRSGYQTTLWDEALAEQLARAVTARIMASARPTVTWALVTDQLGSNMALVPYLEDALMRYEAHRAQYPTLSDFAGQLGAALDSVPLDSCRAAPFPGVALIGVDRHKAYVGWISPSSPFRARGLMVGDTAVAINGDSVSAGGLLLPSRQVDMDLSQNLPFELGIIGIRRHGHDYDVEVPIQWTLRPIVRVASQNRAAAAALQAQACRWVRRVIRP